MRWRWQTWAVLAWGIGGFFLIGVLASTSAAGRANNYYQAGRELTGVTWIWIIGTVVLAVVWARTRSRLRCPRCGYGLDKTATACPQCGYYPGMAPAVPTYPPAPMYPPAPAPMSPAAPVEAAGPTASAGQMGQCPRCGQLVSMIAPACTRCGFVPGQPASPQPPAVPPEPPAAPAPGV